MLLKYTLKNIFSKPGRLIIILICMTAACLAGFLAIEFGDTIEGFVTKALSGMGGTSDYTLSYAGSGGLTDDILSGMPVVNNVYYAEFEKKEFTRNERQYSYLLTSSVMVTAFSDINTAREMELLPQSVSIEKGEVAITKKYSEKFGYQVGDTVTIPDILEDEQPFTVSAIVPNKMMAQYGAYISYDSYEELGYDTTFAKAYTDVEDDKRQEFENRMKTEHPNVTVSNMYADEEQNKTIKSITSIIYLVFVLVFVLVIFVTVSFTEKIITERMSVIGTLRSIGMSMRKTTAILLFENVIYGLMGGILGLIIYLKVRLAIIDLLSTSLTGESMVIEPNYGKFLIVILGAVLIQVMVPLTEVLKAVKTSIRDIIFETRDSEFRLSYKKTITGFISIAAGLAIGFVSGNIITASTGVLLIIVGSALSIQFIVRKLTLALSGFFGNRNMPVAELAANETGSKKPNSGNAVLAVAAVAAAAAIFVLVSSITYGLSKTKYDSDLIVDEASKKTAKYEYIKETEGITETVFIYKKSDAVKLNDEKKIPNYSVISFPDSDQFLMYGKLPDTLEKNEIVLDPPAARKMNVKAGDPLTLTFNANGIFPQKYEFTVKQITAESEFGTTGTLIVSKEVYKELYTDQVSAILIRCSDPETVKSLIEPTFTSGEKVKTIEEYKADVRSNNGTTLTVMTAVMAAAVGLTLIGISGNQLIGFAARKKEYAMLHSCPCSQKKIIRMILIENALLFGISCIVAGIICVPVSSIISKIFVIADMGIYINARYNTLVLCIIVLWAVTMLTALTPIKSLKKMNTAMELKYE